MTTIEKSATLVELEDANNAQNLELAAARVEVRASYLLRQAFDRSDLTQRQLAKRIGVSDGRVSQVLNSDGNLKITTIARFLRALGYRLEMSASPSDPGVPSLAPVRPPRKSRRGRSDLFLGTDEENGIPTKLLITLKPPSGSTSTSGFVYIGSISTSTTTTVARAVLNDLNFSGRSEGIAPTPEVQQ